jgi:hypothetical protein
MHSWTVSIWINPENSGIWGAKIRKRPERVRIENGEKDSVKRSQELVKSIQLTGLRNQFVWTNLIGDWFQFLTFGPE